MENRNKTIDIVKGIAIILVVYGHILQRNLLMCEQDFFLNPVFKAIYTFHMPVFVFISGYLMSISLSRKVAGKVFNSRCQSLLIPLVLWGFLGGVTDYLLNIVDGKSFVSVHFSQDNASVWFVWFLFALFVMSAILLLSNKLEKTFGMGSYVVVYALLMAFPYNEYFYFYYFKWFYLFYLVGYLVGRYKEKIVSQCNHIYVLIGSVVLFIVLISFWTKEDYIYINHMNFLSDQYFYDILRIIYRYVLAFLGIFIVFNIGKFFSKTILSGFLIFVGLYALDIYLIQRYVVEGAYPRLLAYFQWANSSPIFLYIFAPVLALLLVQLCILISKLLLRKYWILNRFLLGDRQKS